LACLGALAYLSTLEEGAQYNQVQFGNQAQKKRLRDQNNNMPKVIKYYRDPYGLIYIHVERLVCEILFLGNKLATLSVCDTL